jgi:hypothetical protein
LAVTTFDGAEHWIGNAAGFTRLTLTAKREVCPAAGGFGPDTWTSVWIRYGLAGAPPASVGRYTRNVLAVGLEVGGLAAAWKFPRYTCP